MLSIEEFADKYFGVYWNEDMTDEHRDEIYEAYEKYIKEMK